MEKLVYDLVDLAMKAADTDGSEDKCVKALSKLYHIPVTNKFISTTNIGRMVDSLDSNPLINQAIRDCADRVLTKWKRQLYSRSDLQNPNIANQNPKAKTAGKVVSHPPPKKKVLTKLVQKHKTTNLKQPQPPPKQLDVDSFRNNIRQQIFKGLNLVFKEETDGKQQLSSCDPIGVATAVESTLYQNWGIANNKYRSLLYQLKNPTNPDFQRKILTGELEEERIAMLKPEDMVSNSRRSQIQSL